MLTRIAAFNSIAVFLDQLAIIVISLALTPTIISVMGVSAFGIWQLIVRGTSYVSLTDGRPHELLKWQIARGDGVSDSTNKEHFGAGLIVWSSYLPFMMVCGAAFTFWMYLISDGESASIQVLVLATALMAFNAILISVRSFPEAILRGSNKGYKQIGSRMICLLAAGILSIYAVKAGHGLLGLAVIQVLSTIALAIIFFIITKKNVSWFGAKMPSLTQIKYAYRKGFWYFAWSILNFGFSSIDILLLGFFASTTHVAKFAVTYYAIQMITTTISNALGAVLPGIGSLIGRGESHRVQAVRNESILYSWWLAFSIAITILFVNGSFVRLWIDDDVFAGVFENLLIVMMALQMVFLRNDSLIINLALEQKEKVKVTLYSLIVIVVLSALLIPKYGIVGLCLSVMIGRLILNYFYPRIISSFFKSQQQGVSAIVRPLGWIIVVILMALAVYAGNYIKIEGWFLLMLSAGVLFSLSLAITFLAGFDKSQKESLINRLRSLKDKKQVE